MAFERDKYRNPDKPLDYKNPHSCNNEPLRDIEHNEDAPPGLYKYATCKDKLFIPQRNLVVNLEVLLNDDSGDLSDFIIQTSDEESDSHSDIIPEEEKHHEDINKRPTQEPACQDRLEAAKGTRGEEADSPKIDKKTKRDKDSSLKSEKAEIYGPVIKEPEHLYGSYNCSVCNIKMNSESTYIAHVNGKRHKKALKAKNVADTVIKSIPKRDEASRYPLPEPGVHRVVVKEKSVIQDIIAKELRTPCPGLHNVIEIRGITDHKYYCKLCDSVCSADTIIPHLSGYKHQLKCLKYFKPDHYETFNCEPKYKVERELLRILKFIERKEGLGRIVVEKDFHEEDYASHSRKDRKRDICAPSTSFSRYSSNTIESPVDEILDTSKSGFYCKICEAFMNSEAMWESHLNGKRHKTNLKKAPGSLPSKLKYIKHNGRSFLLKMLDDIEDPIVGLDHITERRNLDMETEMYQCFLCCACLTQIDIIDHLLSQKHRKKYLQHIKHPDLNLLEDMNFRDRNTNSLIETMCTQAEAEYGRGEPAVLVQKPSFKS